MRRGVEAAAAATGSIGVELDIRELRLGRGLPREQRSTGSRRRRRLGEQRRADDCPVILRDRAVRVGCRDRETPTCAGTYFGCRVAGLHMRERGRLAGSSTSPSIAGQRGASVNGVHYAASKAGIVAITRFAASELASSASPVNAITRRRRDRRPERRGRARRDMVEAMVRTIPVGRLGRPQEVAALVAYLDERRGGLRHGCDLRHQRRDADALAGRRYSGRRAPVAQWIEQR